MLQEYVFHPRILRSPDGDCWGNEIETVLSAYSEDYLRSISEQGYDGIWVHVNLKESVASGLFPGNDAGKIAVLNRLVERTSKHGIKVYCYLLEPRGLAEDDNFWREHRRLMGQPHESPFIPENYGIRHARALCSSTGEVKQFLEESSFNLFRNIPGMGGAFLITASEQHTHCYSHFPIDHKKTSGANIVSLNTESFTCPRCKKRTPPEVASEVINLINRGIKSADREAKVIAWTWSWYIMEPDPQEDLISRLSKDIIIMSDFERGGRKKTAGRIFPVNEYSFSYTGPSPRFRKHVGTARKNSLAVMAKIQLSNTHEMASVPYIPVLYSLAYKLKKMREMEIGGYLGCWVFGGNISPMTRLAGIMSKKEPVSPSKAVRMVAVEDFGRKSARAVCMAWKRFSEAWKEYPFSVPFLYSGPVNYATAYPLRLDIKKAPPVNGWAPLPRDRRGRLKLGDNTEKWLRPFTGGIVIEAFERLLSGWDAGVEILESALREDSENSRLEAELALAKHIGLSVKSTVNIVKFYRRLDRLRNSKDEKKAAGLSKKLIPLFQAEIENARSDRELVEKYNELGYHSEANARLYDADDLDYKISVHEREIRKIRLEKYE